MNGAHIVRVHDVKEMARGWCRSPMKSHAREPLRQKRSRPRLDGCGGGASSAAENRCGSLDERPRSLTPPIAKPAAKVEKPVEAELVETLSVPDEAEFEEVEIVGAETEEASSDDLAVSEEDVEAPRRDVRKEVRKEVRPAAKPFADRPPRRDFGE